MIGYIGSIIFETSDSKILNFAGFTRNSSGRYEKHEVIGQKPRTEFIGPDLDQISFTVNLNGNFGVKPREEMERWQEMVQNGEAHILAIGGKPLGEDMWAVTSISEMWDRIFQKGELYAGKIDVTLEEYISRL